MLQMELLWSVTFQTWSYNKLIAYIVSLLYRIYHTTKCRAFCDGHNWSFCFSPLAFSQNKKKKIWCYIMRESHFLKYENWEKHQFQPLLKEYHFGSFNKFIGNTQGFTATPVFKGPCSTWGKLYWPLEAANTLQLLCQNRNIVKTEQPMCCNTTL